MFYTAALRYREGEEDAPSLIAKGEGALAAQIVQAARAYGVPVVQDIPLARALLELEVGDEIPEALYETVAEVLRTLWEEAEKERLRLLSSLQKLLASPHPQPSPAIGRGEFLTSISPSPLAGEGARG